MGLRVNTNTVALNTQYQLRNSQSGIAKTMERLSSGNRINRASDDAAGLAISEGMRANIRGLKQVDRNAQDGISMTQIAEGALNEVANILVRLREISIQAASDTISDDQRVLVNKEYSQMLSEIDRIAASTEYNGVKLLTGAGERIDFQVNLRNSDTTDRIVFDTSQADVSLVGLGLNQSDVTSKYNAQDSLAMLDKAIDNVSDLRATYGSVQSRLQETTENILTSIENISAAKSRIRDTDLAQETSELSKKNIMLQAGTSILAQANQQPGQALALLNKG